jgi:hypothetical protein
LISVPAERLNEWVRGADPRHVGNHDGCADRPEPPHPDDPDAVLNGIAYDTDSDRLFVTGKRWHTVFEITRLGR